LGSGNIETSFTALTDYKKTNINTQEEGILSPIVFDITQEDITT